MTSEEFANLVRLGFEAPSLEFKPPAEFGSPRITAEVIRAALALSNHLGGGRIVVGVVEERTTRQLTPIGLSAAEATSWNRDVFSSKLATYAAPMVEFEQEFIECDGRNHLLLTIHEFQHAPTICMKGLQVDGKSVLRAGAMYIRGRKKPESREIESYEEMRELVDLAVEKGVQRFVSFASKTGLIARPAPTPSQSEAYDEEIQRALR